MPSSRQASQVAPFHVNPRTISASIALGALLASLCVALPSAAQGMGGSGGGGGLGGSGTGGSGGGSGTGGSGTGGSGGSSITGSGGAADDPGAVCNFAAHMECPDRCPMFATCLVNGTRGQEPRLYYRVEEQRFDCVGLDCDSSAVKQLADYCCERGEFAPDEKDDGGGCTLPGGGAAGGSSDGLAPWLGVGLGLCATGLGLYRRRRARTQ